MKGEKVGLRIGQIQDEDRVEDMHLSWLNVSTVCYRILDTYWFESTTLNVIVSIGLQGVDGYILSLLVVCPWIKYGHVRYSLGAMDH